MNPYLCVHHVIHKAQPLCFADKCNQNHTFCNLCKIGWIDKTIEHTMNYFCRVYSEMVQTQTNYTDLLTVAAHERCTAFENRPLKITKITLFAKDDTYCISGHPIHNKSLNIKLNQIINTTREQNCNHPYNKIPFKYH